MPSPARRRTTRRVNIVQFTALIVALAVVSGLIGVLGAGLALPVIGAMGATARTIPETFNDLPAELEVVKPAEASRMLDADGRVLAQFYSERRTLVNSDQIAPVMKDAIIAIEDWRFESHHGIDPEGMTRAMVNNLFKDGASTQGASTITQQYVKNILMDQGIQEGDQDLIDAAQEQSIERKLREARYAVALESKMTKDQILTGYLNISAFGQNIYGVEAASRAYFSKSASELTLPEAALLAGAVKAPAEYDPLVNPEASEQRRNYVLSEMEIRGYITKEQRDEAQAVPLADMLHPEAMVSGCSSAGTAAYFCEYALQDFLNDDSLGPDRAARKRLLETGGLTIRTTLKAKDQTAAYDSIVGVVPVDGSSNVDTALVSLDPRNGYLVAMAQNTRYAPPQDSDPRARMVSYNADLAHGGGEGFQPGSTFKAFTLVEWFSENHGAYESVSGMDRPRVGDGARLFADGSFKCGGQPYATDDWSVGDLSGKEGTFTVLQATAKSVNHAFADMGTKVDFCQIFAKAQAMGAVNGKTGQDLEVLPAGLIGTGSSITPLSMATAYGTLANNGIKCDPMSITEIEGPDGQIIKTYEPKCAQVLDPKIAEQVTTLLSKSAATYDSSTQIGRPMAAKTGTTDANDNTWMIGFVPQLVAATWTGFAHASATPLHDITINGEYYDYVYGSTISGPVWGQYMRSALADEPVEYLPNVWIGDIPLPPAPKPEEKPPGTSGTTPPATTPNTTQTTPPAG